jgi:hypothetical protein
MSGIKKRNYRKREVTPEETTSSPTEQSGEQGSILNKDDEPEGLR